MLLRALALVPGLVTEAAEAKLAERVAESIERVPLSLKVNGKKLKLKMEPRTTLLDLLREQPNRRSSRRA